MSKREKPEALLPYYKLENDYEIGVDEAGRGPLFGRVYTAAVILPKDNAFDHSIMKDSKRFHSKAKIEEAADYIKEHAIRWNVTYSDEKIIDCINIRQAVLQSMHKSIAPLIVDNSEYLILVDGNDFKPFMTIDASDNMIHIPYTCIEGGDNKYTAIAAASILAKVERDKYVTDLCSIHPMLIDKYDLGNNKGYGTRKHIAGIEQHGITMWHRKSYGICKNYV